MMGFDLDPAWLFTIGGVILLIAEIVAPGFFLFFVGAAALATGLLALLLGFGLVPQLAISRCSRTSAFTSAAGAFTPPGTTTARTPTSTIRPPGCSDAWSQSFSQSIRTAAE